MKGFFRIKSCLIAIIFAMLACNFLYLEKVYASDSSYLTGINGGQVFNENNHEYMIINQIMTWEEAKRYSESKSGYLATITSEEERLFIQELTASQGTLNSYWLGASDEEKEEEWKWITGEPFSFANWAYGEPNNALGKHSENHLVFSKSSGHWNDEKGTNLTNGFVVEWDSQRDIQNADVNMDGAVDILDLGLVAKRYNGNEQIYDINKDGVVDIYDLVKISKKLSVLYKENNSISIGNTFGNAMNSGIAAKDDKYIYYRNDSDGGKLYKTDFQGILSTKLSDDAIYHINVIGNWIYYRNDSDEGKLYKIRTDGTDRIRLADDKYTSLTVSGQWIYYSNGSDGFKPYKIKTNGAERQKLTDESVSLLGLVGTELFYLNTSDNNRIYKVNVDGTNRIRLSDDSIFRYTIWQDKIYYINKDDNNFVYRMDITGKNKQKFWAESVLNLNTSEGYLYYSSAEDGSLYRLNLQSKSKYRIGYEIATQNGQPNPLNIINNWIYYGNGADGGKLYKITSEGALKQAVDNYKVYQNNSLVKEFNNQSEAINYASQLDHSKVVGANAKVVWHNYPMYKVYDGGVLSKEFPSDNLFKVIEYARTLTSGRVIKIASDARDGDLLWSKGRYRVFRYQELMKLFDSENDAKAYGSTIDHAAVIDMNGQNKWNNYPDFKVYESGRFSGEYKTLAEAIQAASSKTNSTAFKEDSIFSSPTVEAWSNRSKKYYVYNDEVLLNSFDSVNDSLIFAQQSSNRTVIDSAGITLWNSSNSLKGFVTSVSTPLNVRSGAGTTNSIIGKLNYLNGVEITNVLTGWYQIKYGTGIGYVSAAYIEIGAAQRRQDIIKIAIGITSKFEGEGYTAIAGNFDGQGLSVGILQWNIGTGTLQPLLRRMDTEYNQIMRNIFGTNYDSIHLMLDKSRADQLAWAVSINNSLNKIIEPWRTQIYNLCSTPEYQQIQRDATATYTSKAASITYTYNLKSTRAYALAFDIATQNGAVNSTAAATISQAQQQRPNMTEKELLTVIANAVADAANPAYTEDVRSRKLCIVNGSGIVHRTQFYLDRDYGLSDESWR
ncbi:DUF5050 domain-containing protein [Clostridium swellfunianum]|uniref:DUF5050 domain-containing protein n=1 Tax=Clostridium swellfunianum TaxID=1367462 RepID=UPI00202E08A2|nr:DUF5050 domain-containing protein [Clostridium swellfunianum]MCM0647262.1 DUF5050 domain-containing protein [Clostridium swellfunianum]